MSGSAEVERLKREVQSLTDKLGQTSLKSKRKRRQRKGRSVSTVPGTSGLETSVPLKVKRTRRRTGNSKVGEGEIMFSRCELVRSFKMAANEQTHADYIDIYPSAFKFLKSIGTAFERVQWLQLEFFWKPALGTTAGGLVSYGIDWDFVGSTTKSRADISCCTPNVSHAIWMDSQSKPLVVPSSRLMGRLWYTPDAGDDVDKGPGRFLIAVDMTSSQALTVGEIWARYKVRFSGTRAA